MLSPQIPLVQSVFVGIGQRALRQDERRVGVSVVQRREEVEAGGGAVGARAGHALAGRGAVGAPQPREQRPDPCGQRARARRLCLHVAVHYPET